MDNLTRRPNAGLLERRQGLRYRFAYSRYFVSRKEDRREHGPDGSRAEGVYVRVARLPAQNRSMTDAEELCGPLLRLAREQTQLSELGWRQDYLPWGRETN
jgi:hypothetical protein